MKRILAGMIAMSLSLVSLTAGAHAHLESSTPAKGARLDKAPDHVQVKFDSPVEPAFSKLEVTNGDDETVSEQSEVADDKRSIKARLSDLQPGTYQVSWQAVAQDTHRTEGVYQFRIKD